jgi:hypothetical protein
MNWFQHDADSTQDAKVKKLLIRHGAVGYAVYFHCLELIVGNVCETNITFELEHDSEIIADNLKITGNSEKSGREIVEDIMRTIVDLGLFTNDNGHIFCFKLLKRINMSMTSNKGLREAIAIAKEENHDDVMTNHDKVMTRHATYLPTNQPTLPTKKESPEIPAIPSKPKLEICTEIKDIANMIVSLHKEHTDHGYNPTQKQIEGWYGDIEKLHRIDGRSYEDIKMALYWAKVVSKFWPPNIMSGAKLRKQFDTIWAQMKQGNASYSKPVKDLSNGYKMPDNMDTLP